MRAKDYRRAAWGKLTNNWTTPVVAYLIYVALAGVVAATAIGSIAVLIFDGVFLVGLALIMLQLSRLGQTKIETLFDGFRQGLASNIVAGVLVNIFTFLWALLFIVPGIVKSYSYAMTFHILADHPEMEPAEAINKSKEMMKGNKWRLFCLDCSYIGWGLLCILTLGILSFWVAPYNLMAHTQFYESIKGEEPAGEDAFIGGMADEQKAEDTTQL